MSKSKSTGSRDSARGLPLSASPASRQTMSAEIPLITHIVHWLAPKLPRDTGQIIPFRVPTLVSNGFQIISGRERITINLAFSSRVWPWMHERDSGARQPSAHSKFLFPGHLSSVLSARIFLLPPPLPVEAEETFGHSQRTLGLLWVQKVFLVQQREAETLCQGLTQEIRVGIELSTDESGFGCGNLF